MKNLQPTTYLPAKIFVSLKFRRASPQHSHGFTLIEILISMAILVMLISLTIYSQSGSRGNQALSGGVEIVMSVISEARQKTLSFEGGQSYSVYLSKNKLVIFPGTVFSEGNVLNQEFPLEDSISISTTSLALSTSTINFSRVTGGVSNYGTVTISLKSDENQKRVIGISKTGAISQNQAP